MLTNVKYWYSINFVKNSMVWKGVVNIKLEELIEFMTGSPQFRIKESVSKEAKTYFFYGQQEVENDLIGIELNNEDAKVIHTSDNVSLLNDRDVLFSLVSGMATIVGAKHNGYLFTQNYVRLSVNDKIDKKYLVYLLNENEYIKKQWAKGLQGSQVIKYTIKQLKELELPEIHSIEKQKNYW